MGRSALGWWLSRYLEYTQDQESPTIFHKWVGLWVLAAALRRRCYLPRVSRGVEYYRLYPGTFQLILVSPSGIGHKSTAVRLGRQLLQQVDGVSLIEGRGSVERLIRRIAMADSKVALMATELSVFLAKTSYAEQLCDFLTQAFDALDRFEYMVQRDPVSLEEPCITFIGCTTPESLGQSLPEVAHGNGFLSRTFTVYYDAAQKNHEDKGRKVNPLLDLDEGEEEWKEELERRERLQQDLVKGLQAIVEKLTGPYAMEHSAKVWAWEWYDKQYGCTRSQIEGYDARRFDHLLRLAMLIAASDLSQTITVPCLEAAERLLLEIEERFHLAFSVVGQAKAAKLRKKILVCLARNGGMARKIELFYLLEPFLEKPSDLDDALSLLVQSGRIKPNAENVFSLVEG